MSTRSRIGILLPDDSIQSVYHHWDGYPEWLGVTLEEHFNTYEKASELIDGGNMGSCYSDNEFHHFVDTSILISNINSFACPSSYCDTA